MFLFHQLIAVELETVMDMEVALELTVALVNLHSNLLIVSLQTVQEIVVVMDNVIETLDSATVILVTQEQLVASQIVQIHVLDMEHVLLQIHLIAVAQRDGQVQIVTLLSVLMIAMAMETASLL
jgi:hypothetical protein